MSPASRSRAGQGPETAEPQGLCRARDTSCGATEWLFVLLMSIMEVAKIISGLFSTCQSRCLLKSYMYSAWSRKMEIFRSIKTRILVLLCSELEQDQNKTLWSWKQSQNRNIVAWPAPHYGTFSLVLFAKASAISALAASNIQYFVHFKLSTGWWKLMKHDGAKRKSAPPLIATWVHQICHEQWHARHNKHLWSQTPGFTLPQNKGCCWQMGRVKQAVRPKSEIDDCSCISLPRPEP